jgi:hypothetical protein
MIEMQPVNDHFVNKDPAVRALKEAYLLSE